MTETINQPVSLSVSLVVFDNSMELLEQTLNSLVRATQYLQHRQQGSRVTLAIVDNTGSEVYRRQVEELIQTLEPGVLSAIDYHSSSSNLGFAVAHNQIIAQQHSNYHLVLNPDVDMRDDVLALGCAYLQQHQDVVLLSPKVTDPFGLQQFLCKRHPTVIALLLRAFAPAFLARQFERQLHYYELRDLCAGTEPVDVPLASGCFMLVRTAALQGVDGFCEQFFLYFEDFDLSLRLARFGRVLYLPSLQIVHHGGNASRKGLRHIRLFISSGIRFFRRNGWRWV